MRAQDVRNPPAWGGAFPAVYYEEVHSHETEVWH